MKGIGDIVLDMWSAGIPYHASVDAHCIKGRMVVKWWTTLGTYVWTLKAW